MSSKVEIANLALSELGASRIASFTDNTVSAQEVFARFELVAEMVMSMGAWPSVKRRANLAQLDETPDFGFSYVYQLPTNPKCLRILQLNECRLGDINYVIEADKLLCNETTVGIVYLAKLEDSEKYDVYLKKAIINALKASMAYKFLGQANVAKDLIQQMNLEVEQLLSKATSQGSNQRLPSDDYIDARTNGLNGRLQDDWNVQV